MRIGFVGAGATGKSTSLNLLPDLGLEKVRSVVRSVFQEEGLKEADQLTMTGDERWKLQKKIFDRKIEQDFRNKETAFIAERTLLDHMFYCFFRAAEVIDDNVSRTMELLTKENLEQYDLLLYFPSGLFAVEDDGMRQNGLAYQSIQDAAMRGYLHKYGIPYVEVPIGSPADRAAFILAQIMKLKEG